VSDSILDIESGIDKIEALVKALREERDVAKAEAEAARRALDDREMEFLQVDEDLQELKRKGDEQLAEERKVREDLENRLAEVAVKVKNLLPIVMEYSGETQDAHQLPSDRM